MESEATSNGVALLVGILLAAFGVVAILAGLVHVAVMGWNAIQRALDTRLSRRAANLENQRRTLALAVVDAIEIIEKLGPEGWSGLDRSERVKAEGGVDHLRRLARNHDPERRPDCIVLP